MKIDVKNVIISTSVPDTDIEKVRNAICDEGAGIIGDYTYCTLSAKCIGTFKPSSNANPYIGKKNKLEIIEEQKIEVICNINLVKRVLKKLKEVHPYEEPIISVIPLIDEENL